MAQEANLPKGDTEITVKSFDSETINFSSMKCVETVDSSTSHGGKHAAEKMESFLYKMGFNVTKQHENHILAKVCNIFTPCKVVVHCDSDIHSVDGPIDIRLFK